MSAGALSPTLQSCGSSASPPSTATRRRCRTSTGGVARAEAAMPGVGRRNGALCVAAVKGCRLVFHRRWPSQQFICHRATNITKVALKKQQHHINRAIAGRGLSFIAIDAVMASLCVSSNLARAIFWIRKSGGQFNVIVDDGGHRTTMPTLLPGLSLGPYPALGKVTRQRYTANFANFANFHVTFSQNCFLECFPFF